VIALDRYRDSRQVGLSETYRSTPTHVPAGNLMVGQFQRTEVGQFPWAAMPRPLLKVNNADLVPITRHSQQGHIVAATSSAPDSPFHC
jgi:hypothetical protein